MDADPLTGSQTLTRVSDPSGFTVDLRGTFRAATDSTLLIDQSNGSYAKLHAWEASAALGYEF